MSSRAAGAGGRERRPSPDIAFRAQRRTQPGVGARHRAVAFAQSPLPFHCLMGPGWRRCSVTAVTFLAWMAALTPRIGYRDIAH
jgi:hypothetical protein